MAQTPLPQIGKATEHPPARTTNAVSKTAVNHNPLPEAGFLRLHQILGNPKAKPPIPAIIPVSKSTWYAGVKSGRYPQPVKLSERVSAWPVGPIRELTELQSGQVEAK